MRDWIAVIITVLGVLLVLAGAALILLRALPSRPSSLSSPSSDTSPSSASGSSSASGDLSDSVTQPVPAPVSARIASAWKEPTPADRLIFWGIVLLVLAAVAAGAITFNLGAAGGATPATR